MGNLAANCKSCDSTNGEEREEIISPIKGIDESNLGLSRELLMSKSTLEKKLEKLGKILPNQRINDILNSINPMATKVQLPEDIINTKKPNTFEEKIIKFNNGEIYKGSFNANNKRDGFGININPQGEIYIGLWDNDQIGNYGAFFDSEGNYYKGNLVNGKGYGEGELLIFNKAKYIGNFVDDIPNGKGKIINLFDGSEYEGDIVQGKKEGKGILKFTDGTIYEGDFKDDNFNGNGVLKYFNGRKYEGTFKDGKRDGNGKFTWEDGKVYIGDYVDDKKQGKGKMMYNSEKYYEGNWVNNKQHGEGLYYLNGKVLKGQFRFGKIITKND
jgi:hypothetical protein